MEPLEFHLSEWHRDARGYRLEDEPHEPVPQRRAPTEGLVLPEGLSLFFAIAWHQADPAPRIVRDGGTLVAYQPSGNLTEILVEFMNAPPTPEGALDFVNRYGPLTHAGHDNQGESVQAVIANVALMNRVYESWSAADKYRGMGQVLGADGFGIAGVLDTRIIFDQVKKAPRVRLTVKNLITALWARLFEILISDVVLRRCAHCNALFTAGVGTGRRGDARFCSDEHHVRFNSLKRSQSGSNSQSPRRRGRPRRVST
jgi:hypothetical protein